MEKDRSLKDMQGQLRQIQMQHQMTSVQASEKDSAIA